MKPEYYVKSKTLVIKVGNELDHHVADQIKKKTEEFICKQNIRYLVFDFSRTGFMDSSGIGILMGRYKVMQEIGGGVSVACVNKGLWRMFQISGIYKIIEKFDDVNAAVRQEERYV